MKTQKNEWLIEHQDEIANLEAYANVKLSERDRKIIDHDMRADQTVTAIKDSPADLVAFYGLE